MGTYKVDICGVNTSKLPILKEAEKEEKARRAGCTRAAAGGGLRAGAGTHCFAPGKAQALCPKTHRPRKRLPQYGQRPAAGHAFREIRTAGLPQVAGGLLQPQIQL